MATNDGLGVVVGASRPPPEVLYGVAATPYDASGEVGRHDGASGDNGDRASMWRCRFVKT